MSAELMTAEEIAAAHSRADAATPGPWYAFGPIAIGVAAGPTDAAEAISICDMDDDAESAEVNADFIAAARTDIPRLIATIDAERARADGAEAKLAALQRAMPCNVCGWGRGDWNHDAENKERHEYADYISERAVAT